MNKLFNSLLSMSIIVPSLLISMDNPNQNNSSQKKSPIQKISTGIRKGKKKMRGYANSMGEAIQSVLGGNHFS